MLTPENIAFLDEVFLKAVADVAPGTSQAIFHRYVELIGPEGELAEKSREQNMLLMDVAREYSTIDRLVWFVGEGKVAKFTIHLNTDEEHILYAPKGSWVE